MAKTAAPLMEIREDMGHLETAFTTVSAALEDLPQSVWPLFLGKLVMVLADRVGDQEAVAEAVAIAMRDMDREAEKDG